MPVNNPNILTPFFPAPMFRKVGLIAIFFIFIQLQLQEVGSVFVYLENMGMNSAAEWVIKAYIGEHTTKALL